MSLLTPPEPIRTYADVARDQLILTKPAVVGDTLVWLPYLKSKTWTTSNFSLRLRPLSLATKPLAAVARRMSLRPMMPLLGCSQDGLLIRRRCGKKWRTSL